MKNYTDAELDEIKNKVGDMRHFVQDQIGMPEDTPSNGAWFFRCPNHADDTPSLAVWDDHCKCFGGCELKGDVISFVRITRKISFVEAVEYLKNGVSNSTIRRVEPPEKKEKEKPRILTEREISAYQAQYYRVENYLTARGIDRISAAVYRLGGSRWSGSYTMCDGTVLDFESSRVVIPYLLAGKPYNQTFRRNDAHCWQSIGGLKDQIKQDIAARKSVDVGAVKDKEILDKVFGSRFYRFKNTPYAPYNIDWLVDVVDGKAVYQKRPYVIVTEGELNAISASMTGFPTIALKPSASVDIKKLLSNVRLIFVAVDADDAGIANAQAIYSALNSSSYRVRYLRMPSGYGDMNDLLRAGELYDFLVNKAGLDPVEETCVW